MTITTAQPTSRVTPPRQRPHRGIDADVTSRSAPQLVESPSPQGGLTEDERAELLALRAEKAQLQARVSDLNLELTLVKAAAALFVGERGRPGPEPIAAPEVA
jgi:hypothetical protein